MSPRNLIYQVKGLAYSLLTINDRKVKISHQSSQPIFCAKHVLGLLHTGYARPAGTRDCIYGKITL